MATSRKALRAGAAAALIGLAGAAALAQERPESILPPGFGEQPRPAPSATAPRGTTPAPAATESASAVPMVQPLPGSAPGRAPAPLALPSPTPTATPTPISAAELARYELPEYARRSLDTVGLIGPEQGGVPSYGFGRANGRALEGLMRGLSAPLASRWMSIVLRRALVSRVDTPPGVNGADFAAERAWLLLRMGEATDARSLVQNVDFDNYTPKLIQVAEQAMLANGDPEGLCPIVPQAMKVDANRGWILAQAMCAELAGQAGVAGPLIDQAAKRNVASGIDLLLADKVVGAGAKGRRTVTVQWDGVDALSAWRFGLAAATAVPIPDALFDSVDGNARLWYALAPMYPARGRLAAAELAAAQGVFSNAGLVDLYGAVEAADDAQGSAEAATAHDLASSYGGSGNDRLSALRKLWTDQQDPTGSYARLVLTARAATRIAPSDAVADEDRDRLIEAMLSAGYTSQAVRWRGVAKPGSTGWALVALAELGGPRLAYGDVNGFRGTDSSADHRRTAMLAAGLAGLGRLDPADAARMFEKLGLDLNANNGWTRAIDRAVALRQPGTVALLAAVGMGTHDWRGVPPVALFHIVRALAAVGHAQEASLIAAEAITRL